MQSCGPDRHRLTACNVWAHPRGSSLGSTEESWGLKRPGREDEPWYQVPGAESLKRGEMSIVEEAALVAGEILTYWRCQRGGVHQGQEQVWSGAFLAYETSCVCFLRGFLFCAVGCVEYYLD